MRPLLSTILPFLSFKSNVSASSLEPADTQALGSLLRKVKRIEIISNRIANDVFSGQYKSAFRGQGIEFDEVREYQEGDDVRSIDWNVTARSGKPFVKRFSEDSRSFPMRRLSARQETNLSFPLCASDISRPG